MAEHSTLHDGLDGGDTARMWAQLESLAFAQPEKYKELIQDVSEPPIIVYCSFHHSERKALAIALWPKQVSQPPDGTKERIVTLPADCKLHKRQLLCLASAPAPLVLDMHARLERMKESLHDVHLRARIVQEAITLAEGHLHCTIDKSDGEVFRLPELPETIYGTACDTTRDAHPRSHHDNDGAYIFPLEPLQYEYLRKDMECAEAEVYAPSGLHASDADVECLGGDCLAVRIGNARVRLNFGTGIDASNTSAKAIRSDSVLFLRATRNSDQ